MYIDYTNFKKVKQGVNFLCLYLPSIKKDGFVINLDNYSYTSLIKYILIKEVKVIYTKLDGSQTFSQIKRNKYFKTSIGKRQIILT